MSDPGLSRFKGKDIPEAVGDITFRSSLRVQFTDVIPEGFENIKLNETVPGPDDENLQFSESDEPKSPAAKPSESKWDISWPTRGRFLQFLAIL